MSNLDLKTQLTQQEVATVTSELEHRKKNMVLAYVLWFFLGSFGVHNFYIGRNGLGVAQLALCVTGLLLSILIIGIFLLIPLWIWVLVDAFLIYGYIQNYNQEQERRLIQEVLSRRSIA